MVSNGMPYQRRTEKRGGNKWDKSWSHISDSGFENACAFPEVVCRFSRVDWGEVVRETFDIKFYFRLARMCYLLARSVLHPHMSYYAFPNTRGARSVNSPRGYCLKAGP